jgi:predicted DNA-binding transcriptional regulator YafY
MDRTERFYKIDQMIHDRKVVSFSELMEALEVSRATLKRDLEYMRNRLNAPIVWDRDAGIAGGYRFDTPHAEGGAQYELPGLWFNSGEVHALLTMQHLLTDLDPGGILTPHIRPLIARLNGLLGTAENTAEEIRRRVLIVGLGRRELKLAHFEKVGAALLRRKRLAITYFARGSGETTEREVSPQRLVYYRENWYLDAWCHLRNDIRNFSLDSIQAGQCHRAQGARSLAPQPRRSSRRRLRHLLRAQAAARQAALHAQARALGGAGNLAPQAEGAVRDRRILATRVPIRRPPRTDHGHPQVRCRRRGAGAYRLEAACRRRGGAHDAALCRGARVREDNEAEASLIAGAARRRSHSSP